MSIFTFPHPIVSSASLGARPVFACTIFLQCYRRGDVERGKVINNKRGMKCKEFLGRCHKGVVRIVEGD